MVGPPIWFPPHSLSYITDSKEFPVIFSFSLVLVLDTAAGVWLDRNGLVTSQRTSKGNADHDPSLELMRRCRHAAASVGGCIYVYGGLRGGQSSVIIEEFI